MSHHDALLVVSFGGPEKHEDVLPFLENVLRGRNVPRERLLQVAEHYYHFDGRSPINDQNRALVTALRERLAIPVYWGNRNWHPMLADTVRQMQADGVQQAVAFATSAFGSYSGCRQYQEDIARARAAVEAETGREAPGIVKIPPFSQHPNFVAAMAERVRIALAELGTGETPPRLVFTAHSIPVAMSESSPYVEQLRRASAAVAAAVGIEEWSLVWQSRSGPPTQPWLEPDIKEYLKQAATEGAERGVVIAPIGFLSDHMEVIYDLDTEARGLCERLGLRMTRAGTVETHPKMIEMIVELMGEMEAHDPSMYEAACKAGCCAGMAMLRPGAGRPGM